MGSEMCIRDRSTGEVIHRATRRGEHGPWRGFVSRKHLGSATSGIRTYGKWFENAEAILARRCMPFLLVENRRGAFERLALWTGFPERW